MKDYLWIYILGFVSAVTLLFFIIMLPRDVFLMRKLKKEKISLLLNFIFIAVSIISLALIICLFILLKDQIRLIG